MEPHARNMQQHTAKYHPVIAHVNENAEAPKDLRAVPTGGSIMDGLLAVVGVPEFSFPLPDRSNLPPRVSSDPANHGDPRINAPKVTNSSHLCTSHRIVTSFH